MSPRAGTVALLAGCTALLAPDSGEAASVPDILEEFRDEVRFTVAR